MARRTSPRLFVVLVAIFGATRHAEAGFQFFTDRTSYEAVLSSSTLIDFEDPALPRLPRKRLHDR